MQPWMSKQEIKTIEKYLKKDSVMLEYGCGGSTIHYCSLVKEYYSVEHDLVWYSKMSKLIKSNTQIYHVDRNNITPESALIHAQSWNELEKSSRYSDFKDYIIFPSSLNKLFDHVLIDGRARPECAKFIFDYVKKDGIVFMHDYWMRKKYHVVEEKYRVIDAVKNGQSLVVLEKK